VAEQRDQEGEGRDEVRGIVEESLTLGEILVDQPELALLEVAETAVGHLRRFGRRARREVVLLDECHPEPPAGRIECDAGPGHPTANHQDVERAPGEAIERRPTLEAPCSSGASRL